MSKVYFAGPTIAFPTTRVPFANNVFCR